MATIKIYNGTAYINVEVTEEFATQYAEMEYKDALIERKETRRHQSLDRSMEHGFDVADPRADTTEQAELRELSAKIHKRITYSDGQAAHRCSSSRSGRSFFSGNRRTIRFEQIHRSGLLRTRSKKIKKTFVLTYPQNLLSVAIK